MDARQSSVCTVYRRRIGRRLDPFEAVSCAREETRGTASFDPLLLHATRERLENDPRGADNMRRSVTIGTLARRAGIDLDEALVTLWDAGIEELNDRDDIVPTRLLKQVKRILEVEDPRQRKRIDYWLKRTGLTREELATELSAIGIKIHPTARMLPKGGIRRVHRRFESTETVRDDDEQRESKPEEIPPLNWGDIGSRRPLSFLTNDELLDIHAALARDFADSDDPIAPPGIKSPHLLASTVTRPQTSFGNELKYPTVEMAAAALMHSVVLNHCFHNGNKRTALVAMLAFLDRNALIATCTEEDLFRFTIRVAQHRLVPIHWDNLPDREVIEIARWIRSNSRRVEKGERPIPWLRLKRILSAFDCDCRPPPGKGNRLDISRHVEIKRRIGRKRHKTLHTQVAYAGDGTTVEKDTVHKIRDELELDERNGYDTKVFYEAAAEPDDFVQLYRMVLRRLARL